MDQHQFLMCTLGAVALCAIVGIYYCAVRKSPSSTSQAAPPSQNR